MGTEVLGERLIRNPAIMDTVGGAISKGSRALTLANPFGDLAAIAAILNQWSDYNDASAMSDAFESLQNLGIENPGSLAETYAITKQYWEDTVAGVPYFIPGVSRDTAAQGVIYNELVNPGDALGGLARDPEAVERIRQSIEQVHAEAGLRQKNLDPNTGMLALLLGYATTQNVRITRDQKRRKDCVVAPYSELQGKCSKGEQAHHIVPDWVLRTGTREQSKKNINRIDGTPTYNEGMAICLKGNAGQSLDTGVTTKEYTEHSTAHIITDSVIVGLGRVHGTPANSRGNQYRSIPANQAITASIVGAAVAKRGCFNEILTQVSQQWSGRDRNMPVNSDFSGSNKVKIPEDIFKHF